MPTNFTENYQLSQWAKSDQVRMEDFNADNAKIDAALASHAAALAGKGNCKIWTTSYVGTGTYGYDHPTSVTFSQLPLFALITTTSGAFMLLMPGCDHGVYHSTGNGSGENSVRWSGNTVSWHPRFNESQYTQMNASGTKYYVIAFYLADQD